MFPKSFRCCDCGWFHHDRDQVPAVMHATLMSYGYGCIDEHADVAAEQEKYVNELEELMKKKNDVKIFEG